jgi:septal ring factor EnvC (AmiA/AmiB activator)
MRKGQLLSGVLLLLVWLSPAFLSAAEAEEATPVTSETQTGSFSEVWKSLKSQLKKLKIGLQTAERNLESSRTLLAESEVHSTSLQFLLVEASESSTRLNSQLTESNTTLEKQASLISDLKNDLVIWGIIGIVVGTAVGIIVE